MDGKGVGHRVDPPVTAETLRQVDSLFESAGFSPGLPAGFGSRLKRSEKTDLFFRLQAGPSITGAQFHEPGIFLGSQRLQQHFGANFADA